MPWEDYLTPQEQPETPGMAIPEGMGGYLKNALVPDWAQRVMGGWNPTPEEYAQLKRQWMRDLPGQALGFGVPIAKPTPGLVSTALDSAKMRKALAEQVPEYSQVVESMGGLRKNVGEIAGEAWDKLRGWMQPQGELAFAPAAAETTSAPAYRSLMQRALGYHGAIIPYVPKSTAEPLLLKTTEPTIASLAEAIERNPAPDIGRYISHWGQRKPTNAGQTILSTVEGQEQIIPHETGHWLQDLITGIYNPAQPFVAGALQRGKVGSQDLYEKASNKAWEAASQGIKNKIQEAWPQETGQRLTNEFMAELTTPDAIAKRLGTSVEKGETLINAVRRIPVLRNFYDEVPGMINKDAYRVPFATTEGWKQSQKSLASQWNLDE